MAGAETEEIELSRVMGGLPACHNNYLLPLAIEIQAFVPVSAPVDTLWVPGVGGS